MRKADVQSVHSDNPSSSFLTQTVVQSAHIDPVTAVERDITMTTLVGPYGAYSRCHNSGKEHHYDHLDWTVWHIPGQRTANGRLVDETIFGSPTKPSRVVLAVNPP